MSTKKRKQTNSKRAICIILSVLFIFFGTFFVDGIYARFVSTDSSGKTVNVAKWAVDLKDGDTSLSQSFRLDLTAKSNPHIASGKFAPSSEMSASLVLDLTGTEVAVDYNVTADTRVLGGKLYSGDITFAVYDDDSPIDQGKEIYVPLTDLGAHTLKFVLSWNADGDSSSDVDFALNNASVSLPVSIRVKQHIDGGGVDDRKTSSAISYVGTTESKERTTKPTGYTFDEQDILSDNPESGFYSTRFLKLTESGTDAARAAAVVKSDTSSMLYLKVDLSAFSGNMNGSGDLELSSAAITAFADTLESIKQNDNTVILRFVYDDSATGEIAGKSKIEPAQTMLLRHISQLSGTFKAYATTINVIQVGFYGLWGECYYNTDAVENGAAYYPETVNALLEATGGTEITIAVRTPQYYNWYKAKGAHADDWRVGIFNDAYGANATDMGTYTDRAKDTEWLASQSERTYYGGEAIPDPDPSATNGVGAYNNPEYFIKEAYKLHTSYLNWEWNQAIHAQWAATKYTGKDTAYNDTALAYIESHLGYRFVVNDVKTYNTVKSGEKLPIDISIENTGFANLIKSKRCDIVITDSTGAAVHTFEDVAVDGRNFISQATVTQSVSVDLPQSLKTGRYGVYLRMSSGETLDNGRYYSAVRFANEDMWNDGLQANYIAAFEIE